MNTLTTTLEDKQDYAHYCGYLDAINGRAYRHSAQPGTSNRMHLDHYEQGWRDGRADREHLRIQ